jgi:hypothetical protein
LRSFQPFLERTPMLMMKMQTRWIDAKIRKKHLVLSQISENVQK